MCRNPSDNGYIIYYIYILLITIVVWAPAQAGFHQTGNNLLGRVARLRRRVARCRAGWL